ncbi:FadR family transcriptional regulator [Pigmentiphaga aceris]|uniref:FadR family transcriptional regulator n=1 Tax=Pigmentiphaga aceris TaxID=1940612 RepID=A0A5C0B326_9BURK|nr:FadR family transcriptional regulator [Pigmentiphaga aceris]
MTISADQLTEPTALLRLAPERLSDRLAAMLTQQIESGVFTPGQRLPTEPELVSIHGVSRTVVREAVSQLKSRGLLVSRQGAGVFVALAQPTRPLAFDPAVLQSLDSVVQVVEVRRALEGEIAALAALRARRPDIRAIRAALAAIDAAEAAGGDGVAEDVAFHRSIAHASDNPQFTLLLDFLGQYLRDAVRVTRANEERNEGFAQQVRIEHHAILQAIEEGDPVAARAAATEHMVQAARRLVEGGVVPAPAAARHTATPRAARKTTSIKGKKQ